MAAPRKYPDELRQRAIRMAVEARRDPVSRILARCTERDADLAIALAEASA